MIIYIYIFMYISIASLIIKINLFVYKFINFRYMNVTLNNNAPPSRLKGVFEALVFARHVLGVVEFQHLIDSRRCLGACGNDPFHIIKQASPLTVKQLCRLHTVLESGEEDWDRLFAGMALYGTYARSRWADAQHAEEIIYDFSADGSMAYIETSVAVHKTARAMNLRHQFLPLVAPATGVTAANWGKQWKSVRDKFNLMLEVHPLMPAPDDQYRPTIRPLGSDEAGRWSPQTKWSRSSLREDLFSLPQSNVPELSGEERHKSSG